MSLQQAKELIEALSSSAHVIELAGPTPPGNEFLRNNKIKFKAKPLVTNRENPVLFWGMPPYPKHYRADEIADVHHLEYRNVDMFLCSYLPWYNDRRYSAKSLHKRFLAKLHYKLGYIQSRANPHISLFRETAKALEPDGLLLVEGIREEDFPLANKTGFTLVYKDTNDAALFQIIK